jgi:hypothetical protein
MATPCPRAQLLPLLVLLRKWMPHLSLLSDRPSWPALLCPQAYTCDCAVTQMVWKRPHTTCSQDTAKHATDVTAAPSQQDTLRHYVPLQSVHSYVFLLPV